MTNAQAPRGRLALRRQDRGVLLTGNDERFAPRVFLVSSCSRNGWVASGPVEERGDMAGRGKPGA